MKSIIFILIWTIIILNLPPSYSALFSSKDVREKEADHIHKVQKKDEKTKYEKRVFERVPSGYMTMDEYNSLSTPKDKSTESVAVPKIDKPSDMKYIPQPEYRIIRYNDPPGSPELKLGKKLYKTRQINAQGIVSPDFTMMVYPTIYYYPDSASTACDLFVIPLKDGKTNIDKILTAKTSHRIPEPILSTDSNNADFGAFKTITPIDFSIDGKKLLAKEKIGHTNDGIWQTRALVYDFETQVSYDLIEIRDAISYYWKEYKNLDLDEKRWDIYPLGFDLNDPARVLVDAYAYTGNIPIHLGIWSIDFTGVQSKLVSFKKTDIKVGSNGYKIIQDGVKAKTVIEQEDKQQQKIDKNRQKAAKKSDKKIVQEMKKEYKQKIKEMDEDYRFDKKEYKRLQHYKGSTTYNDGYEKYKEVRSKQLEKEILSDEKKLQKEITEMQKIEDKLNAIDDNLRQLEIEDF